MSREEKKQKEREANRRRLLVLGSIFTVVLISTIVYAVWFSSQPNDFSDQEIASEQAESSDQLVPEEGYNSFRISAVGDVMAHGPQLESAWNSETEEYEFKPVFEEVRPLIQEADMAIANLETTLPGPEYGYSGYPIFAAPDTLVDALDYAGFDTIITANNHSLDTGVLGLQRTIEVVGNKGLQPIGTFNESHTDRVVHKDINGIKLAILSYTEMVNPVGTDPLTKDELVPHVNLLSEEQIEADMAEVAEDADLVLAYVHWGEEYEEEPSPNQRHFAEYLANSGADIILGSHPHVIQPTEYLEVDGREVFVAYSLGNFISNQRVESLGESFAPTEDGVIVNLNVKQSETVKLKSVDFVPTWVYRYASVDEGFNYSVLPIEDSLEKYNFPDDITSRMENSYNETMRRLEGRQVEAPEAA